ncbi:glycosyltransferase family 4 protein [Rubrivivax sp. JA1024]|uniref:glycosyltransferase family 4 protein n=1 Tax=Rubrivivax sp. JA1026 TaxID=2710888 RepID=UPI0013E9264D|nr:glycosyltransferase family 4 protein [Rubrivivax sp. JA1026]MCD0423660.1 glycosyltransferase family 4 protein [Rubrivivax sp. JA1024]
MKIALLCSGLGHVVRGHEVFARGLFELLADELDITLFKGAGPELPRERSIPCVLRTAAELDHIRPCVAPKWADAVREQERTRIEHETFAWACMGPLLAGDYDVVHCLEQEVCNILFDNRHVFRRTPKIVFSNGGAIPAARLPRCDFVQEHTERNLAQSARDKAFMIPHGVDARRFRPGLDSDFRQRHGIGADEFVLISVGTVCVNHKRMDHVIREVAPLPGVRLVIVGQENGETPAIVALGRELLGERVVFTKLPHAELPQAYAAADAFVLGSRHETFGIVYIEAMAMGLPVFCTDHPNQKDIVKEAVFVDMNQPGALTAALRDTPRERLAELGRRGREIVEQHYDLELLKRHYLAHYARIAAAPDSLPAYTLGTRLRANLRNAVRRTTGLIQG